MKTNSKFIKSLLGLAVLSSSFAGAMANDDKVLNSDPIDINGYVQQAPEATDGELERVKGEIRKQKITTEINKKKSKKYKELGKSTEKLADATEEMIEERKESQKTIEEYNKKIECMMSPNPGPDCEGYVKIDKTNTRMAAPQPAPQPAPAPVAAPVVVEKKVEIKAKPEKKQTMKVLPYFGLRNYQSQNEQLESNMSLGLKLEADVTSNLSVGLGIGYTTLKTKDYANAYHINANYYNQYKQVYGVREIEFSNLEISLNSKLFLSTESRFRPYLGAGLTYNRSTVNYTKNDENTLNSSSSFGSYGGYGTYGSYGTYGNQNYNFGGEEVVSSHMSAQLAVGSDVRFTKNFGMNLELGYSKALGGSFGSESAILGPDQERLNNLNDEVIDAHVFNMSAGIMVTF